MNKADVTPYLHSEAKRYEGKYWFMSGDPDRGRQSYQAAIEALGTAPLSAAVIALGTEMTTALDKLTAQANGAQTLSFDSTSIPGALTSLQGDATTIFGDFQTVMTAVGASVGSQIGTVFAALQTIVAIVQTLTMVAGAKAAAIALRMPEAQALKVLGQ